MATVSELKKQHQRVDLVSLYKELTKKSELNIMIEDH